MATEAPHTLAAKPSRLDRLLRLAADVGPGEGDTAVLLSLNVFLLLAAYYIIRPVREGLILQGGGAEVPAYITQNSKGFAQPNVSFFRDFKGGVLG